MLPSTPPGPASRHELSTAERVLAEFDTVPAVDDDHELAALRVAVALEAALGLALGDHEITPEQLGDRAAVRALVRRHLDTA